MNARALEVGAGFFEKPAPAKSPAQLMQEQACREGILREVFEIDRAGRRIALFYGDPELCWGHFKQIPRRITGWNPK
jgi:hypothetical protein